MSKKTNVLLITIDSLRSDHLSCLGYNRKTTPNIDYIAQEGVLFTEAIANGTGTRTSFPSIMTSTYPLMYDGYKRISRSRITIAEVLKKNGYHTAAFHSNPYLSRYYGYDKGFDTFEDFFEFSFITNSKNINNTKEKIRNKIKKHKILYKFFKYLKIPYRSYITYKNMLYKGYIKNELPYEEANIINKKAIYWLRDHPDNFFLWLHYMDVHHPWNPLPKCLEQVCSTHVGRLKRILLNTKILEHPEQVNENDLIILKDLYDGEIRYVDFEIQNFLDQLKEMDLYKNTLIVITADHGDEFLEHGDRLHGGPKIYDEVIHVPLIIVGPKLPKNVVIENPVSLLDLSPTIVDYLDIPKVENWIGNSLIPLINGSKHDNSQGVITECWTHNDKGRITSYRTKKWKYILDIENNRRELYNLQKDPKECNNLYKEEKEIAEEFESKIKQHIMEECNWLKKDEKRVIKERIRKLKSIGKIQ